MAAVPGAGTLPSGCAATPQPLPRHQLVQGQSPGPGTAPSAALRNLCPRNGAARASPCELRGVGYRSMAEWDTLCFILFG